MNAVTIRCFRGQHVEVIGDADAWGKPVFLGAGYVLGTRGGALLLASTEGGQADAAVKLASILRLEVRAPEPAFSFQGRPVEVFGDADGEGRPTFLGAGYVMGSCAGQLLLRKGTDGPADTAVISEHIRRIEVKIPAPQLQAVPKGQLLELQPDSGPA